MREYDDDVDGVQSAAVLVFVWQACGLVMRVERKVERGKVEWVYCGFVESLNFVCGK